jgi:Pyruvate/2-oxoacid:ferredoxin oxidoreductase gamma subunit
MEITKDDFECYEHVRKSGVTNMFMIGTVVDLSGLTREQCLDIMKNYDKYSEAFK